MDETTPTTPTNTIPRTFTLFPLLPTELRLAIWRASCHPRILEIHYCPSQDRCFTPSKPPVILSVCRESRHEALSRIYAKAFGTRTHPSGSIYFAPDLDILYIPRYYEEEGDHFHHVRQKGGKAAAARAEEQEKERRRRIMSMGYSETARDFGSYVLDTTNLIKNLAIDHVRPEIRRPWETYSKFCLIRSFPKLERAFLILDNTTTATSTSMTAATLTMGETVPEQMEVDEEEEEEEDQIEFIDPTESKEEIMRLMENVSASFSHEVGVGVTTRFEENGRNNDETAARQQYFDCCLDHAAPGGRSGDELALIPKTKVHHHHHHHHHGRHAAPWQSHTSSCVACV